MALERNSESQNLKSQSFFGPTFNYAFLLIIIFECFSLLGHLYGYINTALFFLLIPVVFIISLWKIEYGLWIAAAELFIGSFGYMFFYDYGGFRISIRLGIFIAVWLAWLIKSITQKRFEFWSTQYRWPFIAFFIILCLGIITASIAGHPIKDIFFDFNAYLYFGLFFVVMTVINSWDRIIRLGQILIASVIATSLKTLAMLFFFSHATDPWIIRSVYTWIRDSRVGEIAPITGLYYRIFFQGHIWSLFVLLGCILWLILQNKYDRPKNEKRWVWVVTILTSLTLIISFSRSFWLAGGITFMLICLYLKSKSKISWKRLFGLLLVTLFIGIMDVGIITGVVNLKLPSGNKNNISAVSLISDRLTSTDEAAIGSRYQLLKPLLKKILEKPLFGSGFGTTVSYQTLDPRTKVSNGGIYTTYSFEWGWLDIMLKLGIIGLATYLFLIWKIFNAGIRQLRDSNNPQQQFLTISLLFCIISLLLIHVTTPYLNHPLGIFLLITAASIFLIKPRAS